MKDDDFKLLRGFVTDGQTDRRTNERTFVNVESLSRLKTQLSHSCWIGLGGMAQQFENKIKAAKSSVKKTGQKTLRFQNLPFFGQLVKHVEILSLNPSSYNFHQANRETIYWS